MLELQPALGRLLDSNDDKLVGESRVVVLSYNYWSSRFGLDPTILNKQIIVNGQSLTIVGVAPKGFDGTTIGMRPAVFVPITLRSVLDADTGWSLRTDYWAYLFARLRPGVTIDAARASLGTQYHAIINDVEAPLQKDMSAQTMARFRAKPILLAPGGRGQSSVPDEAKTPLRLLLGVTAFVLLIACANIANLLLARSAARAGEMAIRLSIGASRARLIGQLLTESLLLAVLGGIAGLVVAHWTLVLVISLLPPEVQHTITFSISGTVILFAIGLTFATGLLFGLFPALHSTRPDLVSTLKNQAGQPSGAKGAARFRLVLATSQIALAMMLLASSGFFVKSLLNVSRVDLGFKVDHVVTFGLSPDLNGYSVRPHPSVLPAPRRRAAGSAGRDGRDGVERAASGRQQPGKRRRRPRVQGRTRHRQQLALQQSRSGLLLRARHSAHRRTRVHRRRHGEFRRRSPSSTRRSQRSSAWGTTPSASSWDGRRDKATAANSTRRSSESSRTRSTAT